MLSNTKRLKMNGEEVWKGEKKHNGTLLKVNENAYTIGYSALLSPDGTKAKSVSFGDGVFYNANEKNNKVYTGIPITSNAKGVFAGILSRESAIASGYPVNNNEVASFQNGLLIKEGFVIYKEAYLIDTATKSLSKNKVNLYNNVTLDYNLVISSNDGRAYFSPDSTVVKSTDVIAGKIIGLNPDDTSVTVRIFTSVVTKTSSGGITVVTTDNITDNAVTEAKIADNAVTETKIADNAVTEAKIADNTVTETKIADNAVTTDKIKDGAITKEKLAEGVISGGSGGGGEIADGSVTTTKLADQAVTEAKIADGNVTTAKLAENSITSEKIADEAITTTNLVTNCVTNEKIKPFNITADKFKNNLFYTEVSMTKHSSSLMKYGVDYSKLLQMLQKQFTNAPTGSSYTSSCYLTLAFCVDAKYTAEVVVSLNKQKSTINIHHVTIGGLGWSVPYYIDDTDNSLRAILRIELDYEGSYFTLWYVSKTDFTTTPKIQTRLISCNSFQPI